jgi:hypothetical protein
MPPSFTFKLWSKDSSRAKRIPDKEWEQHKDEIIEKFMASDLTETMNWIESHRGFIASYV